MSPLSISIVVFACVFGGALLGMFVAPKLPVQHQSAESRDIVRLGMGLVATTVAVALGLLVSSAKSFYDTQSNEVTLLAANFVMLDRLLAQYGPEGADARAAVRAVLAEQLESTDSRDHPASSMATSDRGHTSGAASSTRFRGFSRKTTTSAH